MRVCRHFACDDGVPGLGGLLSGSGRGLAMWCQVLMLLLLLLLLLDEYARC